MKKSIILAFAIIATTVAQAQFSYSKKAHIATGVLLDPGGTFDFKDRIGFTSPNVALDFVYTNRCINIRISSERFKQLDNYRDLMFSFGLNYQVGRDGNLQFIAGPRFGWAWRDVDHLTGMRVNLGVEGSTVWWLNNRFALVLHTDFTKRYDQEIPGYTPQWQVSGKVGVRFKLKNLQ